MDKIAIFADLHLKRWNDNLIEDNGIPRRLYEILSVSKDIFDYCVEKTISDVAILGDINDLKNVVHSDAFVLFKQLLEQYPQLTFHILHGNHDSSACSDEVRSAIQLLEGPKNVRTYTKMTKVDDITFIPHSDHILDDIRSAAPSNIMCGHFGLSDATLSSGISLKTSISSKDLNKFDLVFLGHFHLPQSVRNNTVHYVGSPIQLRRDEAGEEKRFIVLDTQKMTFESIPTTGYRKYYTLEINKQSDVNNAIEESKKLKNDGHYVYILNNLKEALIENVPDDVNIIDVFTEDVMSRGINSTMTIEQQQQRFLEIMGILDDNKEEYMQVSREILNS